MCPSFGLCGGYTLDPVNARFAPKCAVRVLSIDFQHCFGQRHTCLLSSIDILIFQERGAIIVSIAEGLVHAQKIACEYGSFRAAGPRTYLEETRKMCEWMYWDE
jgi:hypothetical protein